MGLRAAAGAVHAQVPPKKKALLPTHAAAPYESGPGETPRIWQLVHVACSRSSDQSSSDGAASASGANSPP
jgi:hypothetical protein